MLPFYRIEIKRRDCPAWYNNEQKNERSRCGIHAVAPEYVQEPEITSKKYC
jgi:hypothetical protein